MGTIHSVVFCGFATHALRARITDADTKLLIISDGQFRRNKPVSLKNTADKALTPGTDGATSTVEHILVVQAHRN